jgi:glucose-6-phosphate 1-dehydrogenase
MPIANGVDACDFVIFGGTGDLAVRKLLPALYLRDRDGQLTADTRVIAVARAGLDEPGYHHKIQAELGRFVAAELLDGETVDRFLARLRFVSIDLTEPSDYAAVTDVLAASAVDIRVFYLACAPALFGPICDALGRQGLVTTSSRVVLEKPIGHDLASAQGSIAP